MKNILLVNPWIYDFAAYDYGIKPVGLLKIASHLRAHGKNVHLVDCLDGCAKTRDEFGFSKISKQKVEKPETIQHIERPYCRYGISQDEFQKRLDKIGHCDSIYITSGMTYWYPGVFLAIKLLKKRFPGVPVVLGGIYASLCHSHASKYSGADSVWKGDYLQYKDYSDRNLYPAYDLLVNREILPVQLTIGCPFRCIYCASKILKPRFMMKDPIVLFEEIMHYHRSFGTNSFVFFDDALTFDADRGIKRFLRLIIAAGRKFTFHTPNGLHARYIDDELAYLFKQANFRDLRVALETRDADIQEFTGAKVTNDEIRLAIRNLKEAGFAKNDIGVYLLIGAPWLDTDKTMDDVMFINSLGAKAILASYSPIPGTQDFKALVRSGLIENATDPLWHNKTIFSEMLAPNSLQKIRQIRRITARLNKA